MSAVPLQESEKQAIHQLWDEMTASSAARSPETLDRILNRLAMLVNAEHAYWMGTLRLTAIADTDPICGWRPRHIYYLDDTPERQAMRKEHIRRLESGQIDPSIHLNLADAGNFRINIKTQMVGDEWFESEFYQTTLAPFAVQDMIYVVVPLGEDVESWLAFERCGEHQTRFSDTDRTLLDYAVRPTQWFHKQLALHFGILLAESGLTASEQRVLSGLLTDKTEAEIATELELSPSTVHTYCVRICRKFGVRGRNGLISLWLGETPE